MKRRISFFLAVILLFSLVPVSAYAAGNLRASDDIKTIIKDGEGLMLTAYKADPSEDYYTIGYGHYGQDIYPGMSITVDQANSYFNQDIAKCENAVNNWNSKYSLNLNQHEFDALISITFNFGTSWVEYYTGWRLSQYLKAGFKNSSGVRIDDLEIADSFGVLCSAGGRMLSGLVKRRLCEAEIFLYGEYGTVNTTFVAAIFDANGGSISGNRLRVYYKDRPYGIFPSVTLSGYNLAGWRDEDTGASVTASTIADKTRYLDAVWTTGPVCRFGANCPSQQFTDLPVTHWAHNDIDTAVAAGLFNGISPTSFGPELTMTRAMLVTVLYRLEGSPDVSSYENQFTDVQRNVYYSAILWASHNHIANGFADSTFKPDEYLTREQFATFLNRYASFKGYDTEETFEDFGQYADAHDVSPYARESISWALASGIIRGTSPTTISPQEPATRAQVATMLVRFAGSTF